MEINPDHRSSSRWGPLETGCGDPLLDDYANILYGYSLRRRIRTRRFSEIQPGASPRSRKSNLGERGIPSPHSCIRFPKATAEILLPPPTLVPGGGIETRIGRRPDNAAAFQDSSLSVRIRNVPISSIHFVAGSQPKRRGPNGCSLNCSREQGWAARFTGPEYPHDRSATGLPKSRVHESTRQLAAVSNVSTGESHEPEKDVKIPPWSGLIVIADRRAPCASWGVGHSGHAPIRGDMY